MKSTGIIRNVDDLGRVVIPKETRNMLGIITGSPIEFFMNGNQIVMQKYKPDVEKNAVVEELEKLVQSAVNAGQADVLNRAINLIK